MNSRILNATGHSIIRDFSKTKAHYKIHKQEFKTLFDTLLGTSFGKALESIEYDPTILKIERDDDSVLPTIPVLTSTPIKDEDILAPNFKSEYSKIRKMHDNSEDEIRYRDNIIEQLEKREIGSRDKDTQLKSLKKKLENLEEDLVYRDKIIVEKDNELNVKNEKLRRLHDRLKLLEDEVKLYRDSDDKVVIKQSEFFNKALMERLKEQQRAIDSLKDALAEKSHIVAKTPITVPNRFSKDSGFFKKEFANSRRTIIYSILIFILIFMCFNPFASSSKGPWYRDTPLEPYLYHIFEDYEIDYDYYNLGDLDYDYLQT